MRHEDAIQMNAVEAYLLDDLTDAERTAFEEHYADCEVCFADVRAGAEFTRTLREVDDPLPLPAPVPIHRATFKFPFVAAASLAVLALAGMGVQQKKIIAPLRAQVAQESQPRIMPPIDLREARDVDETTIFERNNRPIVILDIAHDLDQAPYTCEIVDAQGRVQGTPVTISGEQANTTVNLDAGRRVPGNYTLIVSGSHGVPVLKKRFTVR